MYLNSAGLHFNPLRVYANTLLTWMSSWGQGHNPSAMQQSRNTDFSNGQDECKKSLTQVIETQIIPRLVQAHRVETRAQTRELPGGPTISMKQVATFVALS